ncbi:hypothetical protein GLOIN_2v1688027 [Rhizophagus clarus]|uniref:SAM domain-containing protein n=1 Tax=Rhizophagus clarus TaxID=94130 RepID=A0A8H3M874_9GLOM|nr:hypothetical protein GLOIN_2v1688027 [Rhizophagus clarus]
MSSSKDNIILHCLIVPCSQLHALSRDQVVQVVTVGRSQAVSVLEATIQSRLGELFNNIRLKIRQVYPREPNNHIKSAISETSTPYISASISTTVAGNETVSLADEIKKYDTAKLIEFLQGQENLGLNEPAIKILENEEVNGLDFFDLTEEKLERHGMKMGPATRLVKFAKEFPHHIDEENPAFKFCIEDILRRIKNMGPVVDSNEAMWCEYILTILHTVVTIFEGLVILPQMEVSGDDSSGCVDYAIKRIIDNLLEEIICITEGKQNLPGIGIAQNLIQCKSSCEQNLDTLKKKRTADEAFEERTQGLYRLTQECEEDFRGYRGLLEDRVSASEEPANKKRRVKEIIKKK